MIKFLEICNLIKIQNELESIELIQNPEFMSLK